MGIYNGAVAFTRYRLLGPSNKVTIAKLSNLLEDFKSPTLKLEGLPKAEAIGWVRPLTPQDPDVIEEEGHWDISECQIQGGIMLRVRYERRKIQSNLLQMIYKQKLNTHLKATGKQMGHSDRKKLKLELASDLLRRALPEIQFTDVLWKDAEQDLYIFSASKTVCERVLQLFHQTFCEELDLTPVKLSPTTAWIEGDEPDHRLERLTKVEPSVFSRQVL